MRLFSITFAVVSFASIVACSEDEENTTASASAASSVDFCRAYCAKEAACDKTTDLDTCNAQCDREIGETLTKWRTDAVATLLTCWEARDCRSMTNADFKRCVDEARVRVVPSPATERFCDAYGAAVMKCDGQEMDRAGCLGLGKSYNDGVIDKATNCATKSCTVIEDCLRATF
jgi:hypothetical protein